MASHLAPFYTHKIEVAGSQSHVLAKALFNLSTFTKPVGQRIECGWQTAQDQLYRVNSGRIIASECSA